MRPSRRGFLMRTGGIGASGIGVAVSGCLGRRGGATEQTTTGPTASPETTGTPTRSPTPVEGTTTVHMVTEEGASFFDPIGLFVEPGQAVTWEIRSDAHSATAYHRDHFLAAVTRIPAEATPWDSETIRGAGKTFTHTFETRGTYDYFCIPHKTFGMVGRIVVGEPGGPAEGSMPPDGDVPTSDVIVDRGVVTYDAFAS